MQVVRFIPIPSGFGNLGISLSAFFFALIGLIYGPSIGFIIGIISDIFGFFVFPDGYPFHPGYTIQAGLTGLTYGLLFYKTKVSFSKVLFARLIVNIVLNGILGSLCWGDVADLSREATRTYMFSLSIPKNVVYLLPQSIAIWLFFKALAPALKALLIVDSRICDDINHEIIDIEADDIEMIHGNSFTYGIMNHLMWGKIPMSLLGCPRNDILFNIDSTLVNTLRYRLNLPYDKKIILYAPSFRSDGLKSNLQRSGLNQLQEIDITKICSLLNKKFGEEWCFVCRFHYHVEKEVNWVGLKKKYGEHIKNGNIGDDMSEYLACTDILLTDVSSCMFDFALTRKPCFIYFPDLEYYSSRERALPEDRRFTFSLLNYL